MRLAGAVLLVGALLSACDLAPGGEPPRAREPPSSSSAASGASPAVASIPVPSDAQQALVVRNVDGDTVVLRGRGAGPLPGRSTRVRLLLIDTPEVFGTQECFGRQASERTARLLPPGARVRVQADRDRLDRYDRVLLQIWTDSGINVNQSLLADGFATVLVVRPNTRYLPELRRAEAAAQAGGAGRWSACRR